MSGNSEMMELELICIIVNAGFGSKIMQAAKKHGISGGTVLVGKGTVKSSLLEKLAINNVKKEVILVGAKKETAASALEQLNKKFKFSKPNHGIAFTTSIKDIFGARSFTNNRMLINGGAKNNMYHAITVIVEKGNAEDVIDAATKAGSKG